MIKQDLQAYRAICLEIFQLSKELACIGNPLWDGKAHNGPAAGCGAGRAGPKAAWTGEKARALAGKLQEKLELRISMLLDIEREFEDMEDTQMAAILRGRYIQGQTWKKLAGQLGGGNTEDGIRMRAARFWKSQGNAAF